MRRVIYNADACRPSPDSVHLRPPLQDLGAENSHSEYALMPDSVTRETAMLKSLHTDQNAEFLAMLRELRRKRRLRQADLADLLGKSQATVSKVEQGVRRLDLMELRQWLAALDVDFLDFMNELSSRLASGLETLMASTPQQSAAHASSEHPRPMTAPGVLEETELLVMKFAVLKSVS